MALSYLLLVVVALTAASAALQQRIVGGEPTTIEEFPYIVALTYTYQGPGITVQRCVGCLLSSWHVLTTGFCFTGADENNMVVRAGSTDSLSGGFTATLAKVTKHPDYLETPRRGDIAVVLLAAPFSITGSVGILFLPPQNTPIPDGTQTKVVSWGFEYIGGPQLQTLKTVNLFKLGLEDCQTIYADKPDSAEINERVICAGGAPGKGMCSGDSGAPMVVDDQVVVGFSSYFHECDKDDVPDVFTRVDSYTNWILEVAAAPSAEGVPVRIAPISL